MRFPVVLHTDDGVRYGVTVPDLPGCFSAGDTLDLALESVREAIELHLEGLVEDGAQLSETRLIASLQTNPEFGGGTWSAIEIDPV